VHGRIGRERASTNADSAILAIATVTARNACVFRYGLAVRAL
jgi:hypothetical protein